MRSLSCAIFLLFGFSAFLSSDAVRCYGRYQMYMGRLVPCGQVASYVMPIMPMVVIPTLPYVANQLGMIDFNNMAQEAGMTHSMMVNQLTLFGPMSMGQVAEGNGEVMTNAHLVPGCVMSESFENNQLLGTLADTNIRLNIYGDVTTANCAPLLSVDHRAANGVVHAVSSMMGPVTQSINDLISGDAELTTFTKALVTSQLSSILSGEGPFTVFAPSDAAFANLGVDGEALLTTPRCLVPVVENHIVEDALCSAGLTYAGSSVNLLGKQLTYSAAGDEFYVDNAVVSVRDIVASNGIIHVIDTVLRPIEASNVVDKALEAGATAAVDLIVQAGLELTVKGTDEITVLLPSNEAIEKVPEATRARMAEDKDFLASVLSYHVIPGELAASDLIDGVKLPTLNTGKNISVIDFQAAPDSEDVVKTAQCAPVSATTDIQGCNGVVHILDQVMIPPVGNLMDQLDADPNFSTLASLIRTAGLDLILSNQASYTIFAPNNAAFEALDQYTMQCLTNYPELLRNVLMYHITAGSLCCAGMHSIELKNMASLSGCLYNYCQIQANIVVDNANIKQCDITATNGVIHEIECLLPGSLQRYVMAFTARPLLMGLYLGY